MNLTSDLEPADQERAESRLRSNLIAWLTTVRPDGQRRLYSLKPERFRELDAWLARYRGLWEDRLDRFGAALEEQRMRRRTTRKEKGR